MKKINLIVVSILIGLLATSCSTFYIIGEDFNEKKVLDIVIGETTMEQVVGLFGEPFQKGLIDSTIVYIYQYEESEFPYSPNPVEVRIYRTTKTLYVVFDKDGIVEHFTYNIPFSPGSLDLVILRERNRRKQQNQNNSNQFNNMHNSHNFGTGF